jgi:hypothetical protein
MVRNEMRRRKLAHPEDMRAKDKRRRQRRIAAARAYIAELQLKGCTCGEMNVDLLQFHHRDQTTKLFNISKGVSSGRSLTVIKNEIAKCDLLCKKCHYKKRHNRDFVLNSGVKCALDALQAEINRLRRLYEWGYPIEKSEPECRHVPSE